MNFLNIKEIWHIKIPRVMLFKFKLFHYFHGGFLQVRLYGK